MFSFSKNKFLAWFFLVFSIIVLIFAARVLAASIASFYFDISSNSSDNRTVFGETIRSPSVIFQVVTSQPSQCRYSTTPGVSYEGMEGNFDYDLNILHKKTLSRLDEGVQTFYVRCKNNTGSVSGQLTAEFIVSLPVSAKISFSKDPPLSTGKYDITLRTTKEVSGIPSLSYSLDGSSYTPIPLIGRGKEWKGYLIITKVGEEAVGSFRFQARDLEDVIGTEITEGGIFIVDTNPPEPILDLKAEGFDGGILLSWSERNDMNSYKIFRSTSPGVERADFYKATSSNYFKDLSVERGKTYYYRVSAIDEAGNEGALSLEVYAVALLQNLSVQSDGLDLRYVGLVDNFLSDIDYVRRVAETAKETFSQKEGDEKIIYSEAKLNLNIDAAQAELNSLRQEVNNYKSQALTRAELDNKLNTAQLRLNAIKKKIPESFYSVTKKEAIFDFREEDIRALLLRLYPEMKESLIEKNIKNSLTFLNKNDIKVSRAIYNFDIVYVDGTKKQFSLVIEKLLNLDKSDMNATIYQIIPKEVTENTAEIDFKNINYENPRDDIFIFDSKNEKIVYVLRKNLDLNSIDKIKTVILYNLKKEDSVPFTGYFALINFEENRRGYFGAIVGLALILLLFSYLVFLRKKRISFERTMKVTKKIDEANEKINAADFLSAFEIYKNISQDYKLLSRKEKEKFYPKLFEISKKIQEGKNAGQ